MERWADVIVFQGYLMHEHPSLRHSKKVVVVDVYDPFHLEQLEQARDLGEEARRDVVASATGVLNEQLERGDFFMCASDKQRDFWLGQLAALGRVNPAVYDDDESLGSFISVVPFGVGNEPPRKTAPGMRGRHRRHRPRRQDRALGRGHLQLVRPASRSSARSTGRGTGCRTSAWCSWASSTPTPRCPQMRMAVDAERVADELGLLGTHVFFNRQWVAYKDRQNFLLEADIGVSTHLDHVETAFSFRTRILDYLWATLPIVCTQGDSLATLVQERDLGATVPPLDIDALADAMVGILTDPETVARHKANIVQVAEAYRWERTLAPLVAFCRNPRRSADVSVRGDGGGGHRPVGVVEPRWGGLTGDARLVAEYLRDGGPRLLVHKVGSRVRRLVPGTPRRLSPEPARDGGRRTGSGGGAAAQQRVGLARADRRLRHVDGVGADDGGATGQRHGRRPAVRPAVQGQDARDVGPGGRGVHGGHGDAVGVHVDLHGTEHVGVDGPARDA